MKNLLFFIFSISVFSFSMDQSVFAVPIEGNLEEDDLFGSAIVTGDFDADGFDDLVASSVGESAGGSSGTGPHDVGLINVIYGSDGVGLSGIDNKQWHQGASEIVNSFGEDDSFGHSLAVGDFNGDGADDVAIGVPKENFIDNIGTVEQAGAVSVIYGSRGVGLTAVCNQIWQQGLSGIDDFAEKGDFFGYSLAASDFNGDNFDDLAIGVVEEDTENNIVNAGSVHVMYGHSGCGLTPINDQIWRQGVSGIAEDAEKDDKFGWSLAAGNFNGDNFDDLAIGGPLEDLAIGTNKKIDAGAVNVIYGSPSGLTPTGNQLWHQDVLQILGDYKKDEFGRSLAAGDFNDDNIDDLAVGIPGKEISGGDSAGAVNVIYGSRSGLTATNNQLWHQDSPQIEDESEAGEDFGISLAAGHFNRNSTGGEDLAIGVWDEDLRIGTSNILNAGAVNVIYGAPILGLQAAGNQIWNQEIGIPDGPEKNDVLGYDVAAGDFNGDLNDDLVIGVFLEDIGSTDDAGAVNVIYASAVGDGLQKTGNQLWHQGKE